VAASLRKNGSVPGVTIVLTQARGPQSQQTMDEIADSLVVIAASFPGNDLRSAQTRLAAQGALLRAGKGTSGIVGSDRAVPYSGAAVRLMRLVETADDIGIRGASLRALTELPDKRGLSEFLQKVATSRNRIAYMAIDLLYKEGEPGRVILRELYRSGRVTEEMAQETLRGYAYFLAWR